MVSGGRSCGHDVRIWRRNLPQSAPDESVLVLEIEEQIADMFLRSACSDR